MKLREELGQLSWFIRRYKKPSRIRRQIKVNQTMKIPRLERAPHDSRGIWAVSVVRDELDILPYVLNHFLSQDVDNILIADNGSRDGTREFLLDLQEKDDRVHVALDSQKAHWQSEKVTRLAHAAWRAGAEWIIPFDGDEFWFAPDTTLGTWLRNQDYSLVHANFHHMVPTTGPDADYASYDFLMDSVPSFPGKVAVRSHRLLEVGPGNHLASRVGKVGSGLSIAHAQYRTANQLARKMRQGAQAAALTGEDTTWFSPHWTMGSKLTDPEIESVWNQIKSGKADARIDFKFENPTRVTTPLNWSFWNEYEQLPMPTANKK